MSVLRLDISTLRPAKRMKDGRLRVDAHFTRAGVFTYMNPDGTTRRELRDDADVFDPKSLESFEQVPVTNNHPPTGLVDAKNAKQFMVGSTGDSVTRDDDHVRGTVMVADADTVREMESGKNQVSCGYTCDIDATPGTHPKYGRYDAKQVNIRGNHLAIVTTARAGSTARVRMDSAIDWASYDPRRYDDELTSAERGNLDDSDFAWPEKRKLPIKDRSHVIAAMGGHGFGAVTGWTGDARKKAFDAIVRAAGKYDIDTTDFKAKWQSRLDASDLQRGAVMAKKNEDDNQKELLEAAAVQLNQATARADAAEGKLAAETKRADAAEGRADTLEAEVKKLKDTRIDSAELEKLKKDNAILRRRLGQAEKLRVDAEDPKRLDGAVRDRVRIQTAAHKVLGGEMQRFDGLTNREVMGLVIEKLHNVTLTNDHSDDYARARFDAAIQAFAGGEESLNQLRDLVEPTPVHTQRVDAGSARRAMIERNQNAWKPQQEAK